MKKAFSILMLLVAVLIAWPTRAQLQLTVADGTSTNSYVPIYGLWADAYTRSQMIYPGTDLVLMTGGTVNGLTFYCQNTGLTWSGASFEVKMAEVASTTLSAWSTATTTTVYSGPLGTNASGLMQITFTTPYVYQGGNLLIEFVETTTGSYQSSYWYGISSTGSSSGGYSSSGASSVSFTQRDFLPKVTFDYAPGNQSCAWPINVAVSGIDSAEATLSWGDTTGATAWRVYWAPADSAALIDSVDVTDSSYTFTGLNANTLYNVSVMTVCDTSTSIAMGTSFRTLCGINATPFTEGFEGRSSGDVPFCWTQHATGTSGSGTFPSIYNYASNARTGNAYFEFESTSGQTEVVALPSVDNLSGLRLRFYAACTNNNFVLEAGVMEDTVFVVVDTMQLTAANSFGSNAYHEYAVYYNNYNGTGNRMALRVTAAGSYTLMIDDLTVEEIPGCPNPTYFTVDSVGTDWAALSWVENGSASSWYIEYDTVPFTPGANTAAFSENATDTYITLTDLDTGYTYYVAMHADCGGDTSNNVFLQFTTLAGDPATVPYSCNFEDANTNGWEFANGTQTNYWMVGNATNNGGSKALYVTNNGTANAYNTSSISHTYAYRLLYLTETGDYAYSYDWKCQGESHYYDYSRAFIVPATEEFVGGSILGGSTYSFASYACPANWMEITAQTGGSPNTMSQSSSWSTATGTFTITNPGTYKMVFVWTNDGGGGSNPPMAVDNVSVDLLTCSAPTAVTVDYVMPTAITLSWTPGGNETEWIIALGDSLIESVTSTPYTITDLEQYTQYTMSVYAVCSSDDTSFASQPVTVRTTVSCTWPVNLTATATGGDTVMVTWASGDNNTSSDYYLVYGPTGFNPATVGESNWINVSGTTNYEITGLTTGLWDIYVRCDCGGEDGISAWAGPASVGLGYVNIDQVDTLYTCGAIICDNGGPNGLYTGNRNDQVIIYPIDNQHGLTVSGISYTEGSWDYLTIYQGVGTNGTILFQDNTSGVSQQLTVGPFDVEGPITILFHSDGSVYYDGFQISVMCYDLGGCLRPSDLVCTSSTTPDSVAISWNGNGASGWEVFIGPAGAQPDADSAIAVTDSSYVFTNLNGGVTYNVYVRSDCGGEYSDWRGPLAVIPGTYIMSTTGSDTITMCGGVIYDNGGPNGQYSNNCNSTLVVYSTPGNRMTISGSYSGETCCDYLKIFDGVGTTGTPLNTTQYGSFTVGPFTSTTGAFTIQYTSDGSGVGDGYALNIECQSLACPLATEIHTEQVSSGSAILGYTIMGVTDTNTYDDLTLILTSATDTLTLHPTSDNTMVLTGLDSNTTYMAQIFTTCGGVEADTASCTFTTKALPCAVVDQAQTDTVQIGNGTNTSYYIPIGNFYNYSYTQQLISASELNGAMSIDGIDFQYAYSSPSTSKTNVSIYMANVSQTSLSSSFVPYSNSFTLVYTGAMNCTQGWNHFQFTTPFSYDGNSNLLIVVHDNSGAYNGSSYTFSTHTATGMGRYVQNDGSAYDIQTVSGGTSVDYRANMKLYTFGCQQQATCAAPLVMLDSTTTTTAVIDIYPGFQETSWTVEYRLAGTSTWTTAGTATATSYTVTGLLSGKHYEIRVSSVCDGTSFGTTVAATTQCAVVAVTPTTPYFENFEGGAPVCWSQEYVHGQYDWRLGTETYVYHNSTYQHGEGAAELYQQSNTSDTGITKLVTDVFSFSALPNGARLRFYNAQLQYQTYGQPALYLYYRTGSTDSWTVFDSIVTAVTDLTQHEFILPNSAAAPYYQIAFEGHCPYGYGLNVDDVLIDAAPNCSRPIVDTIVVNGATATISWTGSANNYIVSYHNFYDTVAPWTTVNVTSTTTTLTGLTTGNYYELTVTGDCGAVDGQSDPSAPAFFYVPCASQAIPYSENFNSYTSDLCYIDNAASQFMGFDNYPYVQLPNCWMFPNQSHQGISPAALLFNDTVNAFPTNCLWINARTGRDHYTVLPLMGAPIDTLVLLFDYILSSETMVVGVVTDPNDITTFVGLDTLTDASGSVEHYFSTDNINWNAGQDYYIAFHTFGSYYAFIDNIEVQYQPNCMKVADVHMVSATSSAVTIDWTNSSTGSNPVAYQIRYNAQGTNTMNYTISTVKPATLGGLDALTTYTVAVRPICGVGDTAFWSDVLTVSTEMCDNAVSMQNFDSTIAPTTSSYAPAGYSLFNYSYVQTIIPASRMSTDGTEIAAMAFKPASTDAGTYFTNMDVYMANVSENDLNNGFIHPDSSHQFVHVIVSADFSYNSTDWQLHGFSTNFTWDGQSNVLVAVNRGHGSWTSGSSFNAHSDSLPRMRYVYNDNGAYDINTVSGGYTSNTIGDIKFVSCGGGCATPTATLTAHTYESATITVAGNGESFELDYGTDPSNLSTTLTSTNGTFNITGLTPATQYFFAARQQCDSATWSSDFSGVFVTDSLPCMPVTSLTLVETGYESVTLTWTSVGNETAWEVIVYNTVDTFTYEAATTTYEATGLTSGVTYNANVRPLCGSNHNIEGDWFETPVNFTTDICQPVTGVSVTEVGGTTATISWTAPAEGSGSYRIEYGYAGFDRGQGQSATATGTTYTIEGLESQVTYDVYVANICTESLISVWSDVTTFETTNDQGIADVDAEGNLSIYPNPASAMVTISVSEMLAGAEVAIVDLNGRTVMTFTLNGTNGTFDVSKLGQGAYFVRLTGEQATTVRKLIVK